MDIWEATTLGTDRVSIDRPVTVEDHAEEAGRRRRAARFVAARAHNAADALHLMDMLGLDPIEGAAA